MNRNASAFTLLMVVLVLFPATLFGYQAWRTHTPAEPVVDVVARAPGDGGFEPDHLQLRAGQRVRLRISSPDVVHGFAVPQLGIEVKEIMPGRPVEIVVLPEKPGRYPFACIRWCGVDHWRMRGVIEVLDESGAVPAPAPGAPLFQQLGVDLDAVRPAPLAAPVVSAAGRPSAARGASLAVQLPAALQDPGQRRVVAPADAFAGLRADPTYAGLADGQLWDVVAWAWLKDVTPTMLDRGKALYTRDCAACHGPEGRGDGPAGRNLPGLAARTPTDHDTAAGGMAGMTETTSGSSTAGAGLAMTAADAPAGPARFVDPGRMLSASDVLLQGKLLRGGMGTGMPEFGSLYSDEELWALIAYVRSFIFARDG